MTIEAWSPQIFPRAERCERPKPTSSHESNTRSIFSGERFIQLRENMQGILNINLSQEIRNLAELAGLLQLTERVLDSFRTAFTVPLALWDALNMQLINSDFRGMGLSENVMKSTFVHSFRTNLSYCLALRRGTTEAEALAQVSERITARIAVIEERELAELRKMQVITIRLDDINPENRDHLIQKLDIAITGDKMIHIAGTNQEEIMQVRDAVIFATRELGIDLATHFREVTAQELTPYEFLVHSFDMSDMSPEQSRVYKQTMLNAYDIAESAVLELDSLFAKIARSRTLTVSEQRQFIIGLMRDIGAPVEDIRALLSETRHARQEGTVTYDISALLEYIAKTQAALEMISPQIAAKFAETVANITGATPDEVAQARSIFQQANIQMAVIGAVGPYENVMSDTPKEEIRKIFKFTGIPDPKANPLKFCRYIEGILKDRMWLETFAAFHAVLLCLFMDGGISIKGFLEAWSITRRITWLQQLTTIVPVFEHLSLDKKAMQEGILSKLPLVGKIVQSVGDIIPEGLGFGAQPMQFKRVKRVRGKTVTLTGGGTTFQSSGKVYVDVRDDQGPRRIQLRDAWIIDPTTGRDKRCGTETIRYDNKNAQIGSDLSEDFYTGTKWFNLFSRAAIRANEAIAQARWLEKPWEWKGHGVNVDRAQRPDNKTMWRHGLLRVIYCWLPQANIYKEAEQVGVKTRGTEGAENPTFADVPRRVFGSHLLGNLLDYWNGYLGVYLNLILVKFLNLQPTFAQIEHYTNLPLINLALENITGHRIECSWLNPLLHPINRSASVLADPEVTELHTQIARGLGLLGGRVLEKFNLRRMKDPRVPLVEDPPGSTLLEQTPGAVVTPNANQNHRDAIQVGSRAWEAIRNACSRCLLPNGQIDPNIVTGVSYPNDPNTLHLHTTISGTLPIEMAPLSP